MNRIIVDTNVFWNRPALQVLLDSPLEVVVPTVALAERVRQLRARDQDTDLFLERLALLDWTIEPLGTDEALRYAPQILDPTAWTRHARDALIAGHVRAGDVLWTANVKDFLGIGVPARQIQRV